MQTVCSIIWCKCKRNSLVCTEMRLYTGCENVTVDEELEHRIVHNAMVKIMECKIKWVTEEDKQVREYVWNWRYITNGNWDYSTKVAEPEFLQVICLMDYLVTTECVDFVEFRERIKIFRFNFWQIYRPYKIQFKWKDIA